MRVRKAYQTHGREKKLDWQPLISGAVWFLSNQNKSLSNRSVRTRLARSYRQRQTWVTSSRLPHLRQPSVSFSFHILRSFPFHTYQSRVLGQLWTCTSVPNLLRLLESANGYPLLVSLSLLFSSRTLLPARVRVCRHDWTDFPPLQANKPQFPQHLSHWWRSCRSS